MYHIIINPASRSGRGAKIWAEQVEPALKAGNTEYQTYFSGKAGEVRQLAAQITAEHAAEPDLTLIDRKSTRLNSSHLEQSRMPSSA